MTITQALSLMHEAVSVAVKIASPILLLSMGIGIVISIFQAATQIHEQTITFVPKLIVIAAVLLIAGAWMLEMLIDFTKKIFEMMI